MTRWALTFEQRFWAKVDRRGEDECWPWTAAHSPAGYGVFSIATGKNDGAHRVAYELLVGPIPDGLTIDHLCLRHDCVNPAHMEPVTRAENARRGAARVHNNRDKTHCKHGHEFDVANTYVSWRGNMRTRSCRKCVNEAGKRYYRRQRAKATAQSATPAP